MFKNYKFAFCYKDHAKIDLNTLMISINSFSEEPHVDFFKAIESGCTSQFFTDISNEFDTFQKYAIFESVILHEKTHYLDMTSTYYGLEYYVRKHNYHLVYNNKEDPKYENARETFAVSLYELQPLESLKNISFDNWEDVHTFQHALDDDEKYGVYVKFIVHSKSGKINIFPLSMMMLLETRAFCIEYLSRFEKTKYLQGLNQQIYHTSLMSKFNQELNDCSLSEYNFLLKLAILEFERIDIDAIKTMKFLSYLIGWTLNLSFSSVAFMSSHIIRFLKPSPRRDALQMDLSRGMSRCIFPFAIIQMIPIYVINKLENHHILKDHIQNSPREAIDFMLVNFFDTHYVEDQFDEKLKLVNYLKEKNPEEFINEIISRGYDNSQIYINNDYQVNFVDYHLQADLKNVDDPEWGEWIKYPKLCNINYDEIFFESEKNYELISMEQDLYQNYERIHMPIELAVKTLDNLVFNPLARHDYVFKTR